MYYVLYNNKLATYLTLPRLGLWHTNDKAEADSMLAACHEYVRSLKIPDYAEEFCVVELGAEEICQKFLEQATG